MWSWHRAAPCGLRPCGGDDLGRSDERGACSLARDGGRPAMSPGGPACAPVGAGPAGCVCDLDGRRAAKRRSVYGSKNTGDSGLEPAGQVSSAESEKPRPPLARSSLAVADPRGDSRRAWCAHTHTHFWLPYFPTVRWLYENAIE